MCGITGYIGRRQSVPILINQLKRLEYRGYDSAGIAMIEHGSVEIIRSAGKISALEALLSGQRFRSNIGIGHTRWATHGAPCEVNAHPHYDCEHNIAVVHNGIIENYLELKEMLTAAGHQFHSETDTEVLPHLVEHFYKGNLEDAIREALKHIRGSYALALVSRHDPKRLFAARCQSPLIIGLGDGENFLASDIPALVSYTRDVIILEDGDMATVDCSGVKITRFDGSPVERQVTHVTWDISAAEKGGYEHFMLKEIHEQPDAVRNTLRGRIVEGKVVLRELEGIEPLVKRMNRIQIVACGTAYHAGCAAKLLLEELLRVPVSVDLASEFRYSNPLVDKNTLVIVVSQSGETADSLAALRESRSRGGTVVGVVNVVGSSIARESDFVLYTWAGPEICVASTKAYLTQLAALNLLAIYLADVRGTEENTSSLTEALQAAPKLVEKVLRMETKIAGLAAELADREHFFFLGRGRDYAVAMEGALKLKEITYLHAEAYAAGELKHGPLALITHEIPVICLVTQKATREKMISNIKEVKARGGYCVALVRPDDEA
ncbi:MAG: glutamine--fructose-6-phosphate transaminase (isomerizing), partial [Armatimonadota bacterium]